jgi:diguanylate cyclase (GGDEF)-like protein/PAS domain S-box-containing protein
MAAATPTLAEDYEALTQFLYMAPVGLAGLANDGEISMINAYSAQLLMPLSRNGGISNLFTTLEGVAPELRHLVAGCGLAGGKICDGLRIRVGAAERGKYGPEMLALTLLRLDATRMMAVLIDITTQVNLERKLKANEEWFAAVLTGITDYALVSLDDRGNIDDWNTSIGRVTGFSREALIGRPYSFFYPEGAITADRMKDRLREADDDGWSLDQGWRLKADGGRFWGSAMIVPLRGLTQATVPAVPLHVGRADTAYGLILRDITDKREASEVERKKTSCDPLTGVSNRRAFFAGAELELERRNRSPRELSLIVFDIDAFKRLNADYGQPAGDAVLCRLSDLLVANFREGDVVARLGVDQFAVLLPSTDLDRALKVANRVRQATCAQPMDKDGLQIAYTLSAGVVVMDDGIAGLDALLKRAEIALSAAKAAGRNRIVAWSPALPQSSPPDPALSLRT